MPGRIWLLPQKLPRQREGLKAKDKCHTTFQNLNAEKTMLEVEVAVESVRHAIVKAFVPKSETIKQLYNTAA